MSKKKPLRTSIKVIIGTALALIPVITFIFQYWPVLSLEGVADTLYCQSRIPPELIVLQQKSNLESVDDVLKYFKDNNTKYIFPTFIEYSIKNQSQSILPDVMTRHILLSVKTKTEQRGEVLEKIKKINCGLSREKFTFAPLESRSFLVKINDVEGKTKNDKEWDHIFLITVAYCRPIILPITTISLKATAYYSDTDRLWTIQRTNSLSKIGIEDIVVTLYGMLLDERVSEKDIDNYINSINQK